MSLLVVDASCVASWILPSQATNAASVLRADLKAFDLIAPAHLKLEVRSILLRAVRRRAATLAQVSFALADVAALSIAYAADMTDTELDLALLLARETTLSLYDALYLQLAQTEAAALASRDGPLLAAAQARGLGIEDCR